MSAPDFFKNLAGILGGASVYTAAGMTAGSIAGFVALFLGRDPYAAGVLGFFLPAAPMYFSFSREAVFRRRLEYLRELNEAKLITQDDYRRLREQALRWYGERFFGRPGIEPSPKPPTEENTPRQASEPPTESAG